MPPVACHDSRVDAAGDDIPWQRIRSLESSTGDIVGADPGDPGRHAGLRSYLSFVGTFKGSMLLVVACFVVSNTVLAVLPVFIGRFVQALAGAAESTDGVYRYAAIIIGCNILHDLTWRAGELLYLRLLNDRGYEYENILFRSVINERYPYFVGKFTGKISSYIATLGREFRDILETTCFTYVEQMIRVPSIIIIMFSVNLYSGLTFLVAVLLMMAVGRHTVRRTSRAEKRLADEVSEMDGYVIDVIANFVSVKSFRQEETEYEQVIRRRRTVIEAARRSYFWTVVFWASMSLVVRYLVWPVSILLNLHLYLTGQLSLAQFTTFLSVLVMFSDFIWGTVWEIAQLNLRLARVEEAYRYLFADRAIIVDQPVALPGPASAAAPRAPGRLEFRGLSFAYPENDGRPVLADIDLTIEPGEKIGIVGRSGSGKTTLVKLLLGYYPLPVDIVRVDGRPTSNYQLAAGISYVPQDTTLFHRSIRDNITYGTAVAATQEQVESAARRAHAHGFITQAPEGYDTLVGERGIKLSTGQRQRIAIARAFLDDKPMLVLDEATSALDSESEVLVQNALEELWRGKTVIAVAHRLSTLLNMDRIIVLAGGGIVEQGSHRELLDQRGRYHALWQRQSGGMLSVD
ncbi:ABC transporter ATP-binding protein [Frankia sp. QA3]|uniref:ABC transporter ATP-binding protein n=1 Tax=Frankia sp. QA3 TaxID=710111 RepID=UPI000269CB86|nr:ABC-type multidrug transport system, ATPase and permease component [Frankia sp. QA3]